MTSDRDLEAVDGCPMAQTSPRGSRSKPWKFEYHNFPQFLGMSKSLILILTTPQKTIISEKLKQNSGILLMSYETWIYKLTFKKK